MPPRPPKKLLELLRSKPVLDLQEIREGLGNASRATAFRHLSRVAYRRSYNHNGRYYTEHDPGRYDRHGLWSHGDIHFSVDGSLKATVRRLVVEGEAGQTERELRELLRVRVQPFLLDAVRSGELARHRLGSGFVYFNTDPSAAAEQQRRRQERLDAAPSEAAVSDLIVIAVLLVLIRHPGSQPADVTRRLRGRSPPIALPMVDAVFARYNLAEKGGSSIC